MASLYKFLNFVFISVTKYEVPSANSRRVCQPSCVTVFTPKNPQYPSTFHTVFWYAPELRPVKLPKFKYLKYLHM